MTERHSKGDRLASTLGKRLDNIASCAEPPSKEGNTTVTPSKPKSPRRRSIAKVPNKGKQLDGGKLRINVFQGIAELVRAKGYRVAPSSPAGMDLVVSKSTELSGHGYVVDILPFKFHQELGLITINDSNGGSQVFRGENDGINPLGNELVQNAKNLITAFSERDGGAKESDHHHLIDTLVEGLETRSVNLLFGKLNYMRLNGKDVAFWVNPVLLTASQLENGSGELEPWIPIPAKLRGLDFDVVSATHLTSYLDLREKEVRTLGREALKREGSLGDFPKYFRMFRLLTLSAALTLIVAFLALAPSIAAGLPIAQLALSLALGIEVFGGWRLLRSYRRLQRGNNTKIHLGSRMVTPEQVVMNEAEFSQEELSYLYSKYGGRELSRLKKELRTQRIDELVRRTEDLFNKAEKFESEKQYSEAILSIERATRSALNATLLSMGIEVQARDFDQWIPSLKNILQEDELEDLRNLGELRDKVSKGYDASHHEVEKIRETIKPIIESAVDQLRNSFKGDGPQDNLSAVEAPRNDLHVSSPRKANHSREQLRARHGAQEIDESEPRISNEVLNTTQSLKFLLNVADDKELLNLGSAGEHLVKAKKTLETNADDESNRSELPDMDSTRISDELDGLTRSLTSQQAIPKAVQVGRPNSSNPFSEKVTAPKQILPFENLIDFRKAITRCQLPLVTSFLSDDEPSKEVENALRHLVAKHHTRAAFIAVHSKSEDIARECKIRSYPTILVFRDGKTLGELKLTNCEQLEKDLVEVIERAASDDHREVTPTESISQTMLAEKSPQTNRLVNKVMGQARERCKTCNE